MSGKLQFEEEDRTPSLIKVWGLCLAMLASRINQVTYKSFLSSMKPVQFLGNHVTLGVSSAYAREYLQKRALNAIRSALEFHLDANGLDVSIVVLPGTVSFPQVESKEDTVGIQPALPLEEETLTSKSTSPGGASTSKFYVTAGSSRTPPSIPTMPIDEKCLFENFLVGQSNRLAHAAALSVSTRPGKIYNPLFIYGDPGLGKTHLLHAIANSIRVEKPSLRVVYLSSQLFAQYYITSIKEHSTEAFRTQFRSIDVLLIDDIQSLGGKEHTKEEFFHTFNTLYQGGRQVVIVSDRSPRELTLLDERLRTRFQSGLIADISSPEIETRLALLRQFRNHENISIDDEILQYIGSAIQSNVRALQGAITRLAAYSSIMNIPATLELAQRTLTDYFIDKPVPLRHLTSLSIIEVTAAHFGMKADQIIGPNRNKDVSLARQIAMSLCREMLPAQGMRETGHAFGGRDHTTILYACRRIQQLMEVDPDVKQIIDQIRGEMTGGKIYPDNTRQALKRG